MRKSTKNKAASKKTTPEPPSSSTESNKMALIKASDLIPVNSPGVWIKAGRACKDISMPRSWGHM